MSTPIGGFSSSINTGLPQIPDLADIQTPAKLTYNFIQVYNAIQTLSQGIDAYTGNTPASSASSGATPESTVIVGNMANMYANASVAIAAGFLVTLINVGGVTNARLANAALGFSGVAHGLSMGSASAGSPVQILLLGLFNFGGGVNPGSIYYLSDVTPGGISSAAPSASGHLIQGVGFGVDVNSLFINPSLNNRVN